MTPIRGLLLLLSCCVGHFMMALIVEGTNDYENEPLQDAVVESPPLGESAEERSMQRFHHIVFNRYADAQMSDADQYRQAKTIKLHWVAWSFLSFARVVGWLDHNTLLGWYREGRILPRDWAITFGVKETHFSKLHKHRTFLKKHKCEWRNTTSEGRSIGTIHCSWMQTPGAAVYVLGYVQSGPNLTAFTQNTGCQKGIHNLSEPCRSCPIHQDWYLPLNCSSANQLFSLPACVPRRTGLILSRYYGSIRRGANCSDQCCVGGEETQIANPLLSEQPPTAHPSAEYDPDRDPDNE